MQYHWDMKRVSAGAIMVNYDWGIKAVKCNISN
jgi:hypothetical protein